MIEGAEKHGFGVPFDITMLGIVSVLLSLGVVFIHLVFN